MSSRLNPRDYDLGELRDAVREPPRDADGPGDGPGDGRPGDLSAVADLLHDGAGEATAAEETEDARPDESAVESPDSVDESIESPGNGRDVPSGADDDRSGGRRSVGRMRQSASARFGRSASRDRTPDGQPRRRDEVGGGERSGAAPSYAGERPGHAATSPRASGTHGGGFELLAAGAGGDLERPYLERLPDAYRAQLEVFEWLEGLVATCGRAATADALAYYEAVGWLSEETLADLEGFLEGLSAAEPPDPRPPGVADHRESLRYVARLAQRAEQ